jgi:PAS domain-containing protein
MNSAIHPSIGRQTLPDDPFSVVMPAARPAEHRKERRYLVNQPAQIITGMGGPMWSVQIRDISTRGMQLLVNQPVCAGPDIQIRWHDRIIKGTVRYKRSGDAQSYRIGVEFDEAAPTLVIDMLKKQSEEAQSGASLVQEQRAVLQNYLALQDLASEWPGILPQPVLSPKKYGTLLDQAQDAMIVTSMGGTVLFWNKAAEQLYGWTMDEAFGRQTSQLFEAPTGTNAPSPGTGEILHRCKNGAAIRVRSCSIIQQDAHGEPEAVIFINRKVI